MTPSELIRLHKEHNPASHFFDKATLKFFGERVSDMRVCKAKVVDREGQLRPVYRLTSKQRNAPFAPLYSVHYFDETTYEEVDITCEV